MNAFQKINVSLVVCRYKLLLLCSHSEKQRNEETNQRAKTMDLLNDAVRKLDHLELTNKSLDMKFKQADERARTMEMKQVPLLLLDILKQMMTSFSF